VTLAGRALRLIAGGALAWGVFEAIASPGVSAPGKAAALGIIAATLWQPSWGLVLLALSAPAGALLAAPPARGAELLAWALVAAWLVSIWRPLSTAGWPRMVLVPLALYAGALVASWLSLTIGGAAGVLPGELPRLIAAALAGNHLLLSSPEAETWTLMQALAGLGVFYAATGIARDDARAVRAVGWALVTSLTVLAVATLVQAGGIRGERFSLAVADVNAAGSLYALAAVIALGYAWLQRRQRFMWLLVLLVIAPAVWLSGSRSAYLAIVTGAAALAALRHQWQPTPRHLVLGAALFLATMLAAGLLVNPQPEADGSAGQSVNLRSQFLVTSARMFASAPAFGVGVGRYFIRSAEFMTPELRELYGNENAHNYFAQQFAELGIAGGLLFVWLIGAVLTYGWRAALRSPGDVGLQALLAGTGAYMLTCATGHPLLVPEAAVPFWAAFGVVASTSSSTTAVAKPWRALAVAASVMLAAGLGRAAMAYARPAEQPPEQGFHQAETTRDGAEFRWMTRHAVTYVPGPGFLRLRVRAPGWATSPVVLETSIGGEVVDRHEVPADESTTWEIPARVSARIGFRRIDFRADQEWFEEVRLGRRTARRPVSLMIERMEWDPLR
jgi:O-antigen ligase